MVEIMDAAKEKMEEMREIPAQEGAATRTIEDVTSKVPSVFFLTLGIAGIVASASLAMAGEKYQKSANFVGLWVPTFLLLGIYNKIVKVAGSDRYDQR